MIFSENRYPLFGIMRKRAKPMSNVPFWQAGVGSDFDYVVPALVAAIYVLIALVRSQTWMAGTSPAMTNHPTNSGR
jgi:hypothetical protein